MPIKVLLESKKINLILSRLVCELIENHKDFNDTVLIGLQPRGVFLFNEIIKVFENKHPDLNIKSGILDFTFFRDDFRRSEKTLSANSSEINFTIENKRIVLIDDVLFTGRTVRAAMDELFAFGRPDSIKLGVLVDRGHRELPIRADFIGKNFPTSDNEHVHVLVSEIDGDDKVNLVKY